MLRPPRRSLLPKLSSEKVKDSALTRTCSPHRFECLTSLSWMCCCAEKESPFASSVGNAIAQNLHRRTFACVPQFAARNPERWATTHSHWSCCCRGSCRAMARTGMLFHSGRQWRETWYHVPFPCYCWNHANLESTASYRVHKGDKYSWNRRRWELHYYQKDTPCY